MPTDLCVLAAESHPRPFNLFLRLSHSSYPQCPLPGLSLCIRRRRRTRWQPGWLSAGWGKFLDRVQPHPPGSRCCGPRPTWRVSGLPSLKLREEKKMSSTDTFWSLTRQLCNTDCTWCWCTEAMFALDRLFVVSFGIIVFIPPVPFKGLWESTGTLKLFWQLIVAQHLT